MSVKRSVDPCHRFIFPSNIVKVDYKGKILVISPNTANWIVLENDLQFDFFKLLVQHQLDEALALYTGGIDNAKYTVTQIVARDFCNTETKSCINDSVKQLHFYLTNSCNMTCPHCYMFSGKKSEQELSSECIKKVLTSYSEYGSSVTFSGGEITMRKDLYDIVAFASNECKLNVRLMTNGVLWDESMIDKFSPIINSVQISIDGYSEESNALVRGKGNFKKAINTLIRFASNGVHSEVAITPPFSVVINHEEDKYVEFCKELFEILPHNNFSVKFSEQIIDGRSVHLTQEEQMEYFNSVSRIKAQIAGYDIRIRSFANAFRDSTIMDNCMYGVFSIDATGQVYLCARVPSLKPICNVKNTPFSRIVMLSKKAQDISRIDNFKPCNSCELMYICGGGCRVDYFPEFAQITDVSNCNVKSFSPRKCTSDLKEKFYDLMIESNHLLYR